MIPYKRDFVTLNKSVVNYLPRCLYHILYYLHLSKYIDSDRLCYIFFVVDVLVSPLSTILLAQQTYPRKIDT